MANSDAVGGQTITTTTGGRAFSVRPPPRLVLGAPVPAAIQTVQQGYVPALATLPRRIVSKAMSHTQDDMPAVSSFSSWSSADCRKNGEETVDEGSGSSCSYTESERKLTRVAEATPDIALLLQESSSEMRSVEHRTAAEMKTKLGGKYDDLIDPNLSMAEKKKQRRILANRASARRSRERKKETMRYLCQRERDLVRERDAALADLNEQRRVNAVMRDQLAAMQRQVELYRLANLQDGEAMYAQPTDIKSAVPAFTTPIADNELIWTNCSERAQRQADEKELHSLFSWGPYGKM